jgi:hypothetical protein
MTAPEALATQPLRNRIDGDDTFGAEQECAFDGELSDRSER